MKKFIILYHAPAELMVPSEDNSPEDMEKGMKEWMDWAARCGDKLIDFGNPLNGGQKILGNGKSEDSKREVCGFSILQAENMDEAKRLLDNHPHLTWDKACQIEVHEFMPLPGQ